jgi:hypothetical protein
MQRAPRQVSAAVVLKLPRFPHDHDGTKATGHRERSRDGRSLFVSCRLPHAAAGRRRLAGKLAGRGERLPAAIPAHARSVAHEEAGLDVEEAARTRDEVRPDRIVDLRLAIRMVANAERSLNKRQAGHEDGVLRALLHFEAVRRSAPPHSRSSTAVAAGTRAARHHSAASVRDAGGQCSPYVT